MVNMFTMPFIQSPFKTLGFLNNPKIPGLIEDSKLFLMFRTPIITSIFQYLQMPFLCSICTNPRIMLFLMFGTPIIPSIFQYLQIPSLCSPNTSLKIPRASVLMGIFQYLQMPSPCSICTSP
jgi:hypothetical protein